MSVLGVVYRLHKELQIEPHNVTTSQPGRTFRRSLSTGQLAQKLWLCGSSLRFGSLAMQVEMYIREEIKGCHELQQRAGAAGDWPNH